MLFFLVILRVNVFLKEEEGEKSGGGQYFIHVLQTKSSLFWLNNIRDAILLLNILSVTAAGAGLFKQFHDVPKNCKVLLCYVQHRHHFWRGLAQTQESPGNQ